MKMKKTISVFMCLVLLSTALVLGPGMTAKASENPQTYYLYAFNKDNGDFYGYLDCNGMLITLAPDPIEKTQQWIITYYETYCTIFCPYLGANGA